MKLQGGGRKRRKRVLDGLAEMVSQAAQTKDPGAWAAGVGAAALVLRHDGRPPRKRKERKVAGLTEDQMDADALIQLGLARRDDGPDGVEIVYGRTKPQEPERG